MLRRSFLTAMTAPWPIILVARNLTAGPDIATVEATADASVHGRTLVGTDDILSASDPSDAVLLRFRNALIEKWMVSKAVIALHVPAGDSAPDRIMVTGLTEAWNEGTAKPPKVGEGIATATRALKDNWMTFELPANIARQLAWGASASVALTVTRSTRLAVHSRRTGQFMPYLLVRGQRPLLRYP